MLNAFNILTDEGPVYELEPESLSLLSSPEDYYNNIIQMVKECSNNLIISSLYLGGDYKTMDLVSLHAKFSAHY